MITKPETIEKIINKKFDTLEHKINNISKEQVIKEIENHPSQRDSRFSPFVTERYNNHKYTIIQYLKGNLKELGSAEKVGSEEINKFKVIILDNFRMLYVKKDDINHPVPVGNWMDWWEPDHKYQFGVSKEQYKNFSLNERANLESQLQLLLWVNKEYYSNYADFYLPQEYDKWWWDEDGASNTIKNFDYSNNYWKERLSEKKHLKLTSEDIFDITTTGMSYYNSMIQKGHIAGNRDPVEYFKTNKGITFKIEWMSPDEYLEKSYLIHQEQSFIDKVKNKSLPQEIYMKINIDFDLVEQYKERTIKGSKMPIPMLDYNNMSQEGRHRAVVAQQLGVEEIPVLVVRPYEE